MNLISQLLLTTGKLFTNKVVRFTIEEGHHVLNELEFPRLEKVAIHETSASRANSRSISTTKVKDVPIVWELHIR